LLESDAGVGIPTYPYLPQCVKRWGDWRDVVGEKWGVDSGDSWRGVSDGRNGERIDVGGRARMTRDEEPSATRRLAEVRLVAEK